MISYKYKLYRTDKTKHLDKMLREAAFVWNHALALQKRYYRLFGKYIDTNRMQKHFVKRITRNLLHSSTTQEVLQRLDTAYRRFFKHLAKRPPKFRKAKDFTTIVFKGTGGYSLNGNVLTINRISKRYKFSLSRPYDGKVKTLTVKRSSLGEYFIIMVLDKAPASLGKTHNGASVGIDFGLKTYMTMSDGTTVKNPQFLKTELPRVQRASRKLSKTASDSHHRQARRKELDRILERIVNQRNEFVNQKNKAIQEAQRALNEVAVKKAEAEKMLVQARAEREANELKTASLTPAILKKMWIEKWDGKLPVYGNVPQMMMTTK